MFCEVVLALCVVGQARFLGNVSCTRCWTMVVKKSTSGCPPLPVTVANEGHWEIYVYNDPGGDCCWAGGQPNIYCTCAFGALYIFMI